MIKKSVLIYNLFNMCYESNEKMYILRKEANEFNDIDKLLESNYVEGKADGAEFIINICQLMDEYRKYCNKRDKGKSHFEIISKLK